MIGRVAAKVADDGNDDEVLGGWRAALKELAKRPNVVIKVGGLGMRWVGFDYMDHQYPPTSADLAADLKPLVESCIEAFGPSRTMFEGNFPVDKASCSYRALWNAYKRIVAGYSESEQADMFAGTAIRAYRLPEELGQPAAWPSGRSASSSVFCQGGASPPQENRPA